MNRKIDSIAILLGAMTLLGIAGFFCGCDQPAKTELPTTQMQIGGKSFTLEIATTLPEWERGLMHRDHLDSDHGMLFIFPDEAPRVFYNHDVSFPLDVVFLNSKQTVVSIIHLETYSDLDVPSGAPARYAIELNAGTADQLHVTPGTQLEIPTSTIVQSVP
jgi:uncharacterized protein